MSAGVSLSCPGHPGSGKHTQNVSKVKLMQKRAEQSKSLKVFLISKLLRKIEEQTETEELVLQMNPRLWVFYRRRSRKYV